jgi:hypothetical protein
VENNHGGDNTEIQTYEYGPPPAGNTIPSERCLPIRSDKVWFWHPEGNCDIMSYDGIAATVTTLAERSCNVLLDLTPDTTGRLPQCQVDAIVRAADLLPWDEVTLPASTRGRAAAAANPRLHVTILPDGLIFDTSYSFPSITVYNASGRKYRLRCTEDRTGAWSAWLVGLSNGPCFLNVNAQTGHEPTKVMVHF